MRGLSLVSFCVISFCGAQISTFFSSSDLQAVQNKALTALQSPDTAKHAYFATQILESTQFKYTCNCQALATVLERSSTSHDVFYGLSSSQSCGCGGNANKDAESKIFADLKVRFIV
jgi:hypothetical protein